MTIFDFFTMRQCLLLLFQYCYNSHMHVQSWSRELSYQTPNYWRTAEEKKSIFYCSLARRVSIRSVVRSCALACSLPFSLPLTLLSTYSLCVCIAKHMINPVDWSMTKQIAPFSCTPTLVHVRSAILMG